MTENQVKITYSDNNPNYLSPKLQGGNNIVLTDNGNFIRIDAITSPGDHAVLVDGNDTSPGYLLSKLTAGQNVTLTNNGSSIEISSIDTGMLNPMTTLGDIIVGGVDGAPDRLGIGTDGYVLTASSGSPTWAAIPTQTGDHKVIIDSNDTSPGYLASKLTAGTNITITNNGTDLEISSIDTGMLNPMNALGDIIIGGASGDPARLGIGSEGYVLTVSSGSPAWTAIPTQTGDHKVIIDSNDTSPGYLASKLTAGSNVTITNNGTDLEISSTDTGFANPMTTDGDLIIGGSSGTPTRLAKGYQGQVLKVGSSSLEWTADVGFANPMEELGDLIVGTYDGVASRLPIGTVNQFLFSNGTTAEWATLPMNIDWFVKPGLTNGDFNQVIDRTFYVRMYPSLQMRAINHVAMILSGAVASDVIRAAVYDNARTMVAYGESTSSSSTFRRVTLTKLQPWTPGTNDLYYLGVSIHSSSNASTKIKTASVSSPAYCWYEDVALTSGRAMPAPSSLTLSSSKVPIIGLRGR